MLNLALKVSFSEFELMLMWSCFSPLRTDCLLQTVREERKTSLLSSSQPQTTWCKTW